MEDLELSYGFNKLISNVLDNLYFPISNPITDVEFTALIDGYETSIIYVKKVTKGDEPDTDYWRVMACLNTHKTTLRMGRKQIDRVQTAKEQNANFPTP